MKATTRALHTRVDPAQALPAVTPLFQNSAFTAESPYFYTRKNNPNIAELEEVVRTLEGAEHAVAVSCGMAAIYAAVDLLSLGDLIVVNRHTYGCTLRLFDRLQVRRGLRVVNLDLTTAEGVAQLPPGTAMVFFETPTNPFLRTVPIAEVVARTRETSPDALVVVDNTWATPLFQRPLEHGADISLHSATKYFSGHSDVMGGVLLTNRTDVHSEVLQTRFYGGLVLDPHSAWLLRRSLQTLELRMARHQETTRELVEFLRARPQIRRCYHPEVDGRQLTGYGGIVFIEFQPNLAPFHDEFVSALTLFGTGTGMAAVTSMVARPYTGSHASLSPDEKTQMGLGPDLVRLCFGLEHVDDLKADLSAALEAAERKAERGEGQPEEARELAGASAAHGG